LVLCQKAFSKTITLGRSGQLVIPVAEDSTIVIWNFDYQNFLDVIDFDNMDEVFARSVHQVIIRSPKSLNTFIIRDDVTISQASFPPPVGDINIANVFGHYNKDVYLVHSENIIITISAAPPLLGTASVIASPPNLLNPESPPRGYGSAAGAIPQTTNEIYPGVTGEVLALSTKFGVSSAGSPMPTGDLRYPINASTALKPTHVTSEQGQRSYPILNINYVEIPRNVAEELFSSS